MTTASYAAYPLLRTYLADLKSALSDIPNDERVEVLRGVEDHIQAQLDLIDGKPSSEQIRAVLDGLGPIEDLCAAWSQDAATPLPTTLGTYSVTNASGASELVAFIAFALTFLIPMAGIALAFINSVWCTWMVWDNRARVTARRPWRIALIIAATAFLLAAGLTWASLAGEGIPGPDTTAVPADPQ